MFERSDLQVLKARIDEPRKFIQVIVGPRQVGKTTLANQLFMQLIIPAVFESADAINVDDSVWLEQIWETARLKMRSKGLSEYLIIIDEVQKIRNWSESIKKFWDEDSRRGMNIKLILLGSSRLLVQKGLTESLAGRFETMNMTHWSYTEMRKAFGWNHQQYVWYGGYPGTDTLIRDEKRWKDYVRESLIETSISKDILMLSRIDKPSLLKKLFELGCLFSGQILSFNKIMGQLQDAGNTTTLAHYLRLLGGAGLLEGLEKYSGSEIRKRSSSPKFQVYNNALLSAQNEFFFDQITRLPDQWGRMVESSIGAYLVNESITKGFSVYYWREGIDEIDFVIEKAGRLIGIEVKSSISKQTAGMQKFKSKYAPDKIYLIDNKALSWEEFLEIDPLELF